MSYFINICFICLENSNNLLLIRTQDTKRTSLEDKLKYFLPELELNSNTPKYICVKCGRYLNDIYEFKQKCLRNMPTYENYAQQVATIDGSYKYLSVPILPDFVYEEEVSDGNILKLISEISVEQVKIENLIETETNELLIFNVKLESSSPDIEENSRSGDICPDFVYKENKSDDNNCNANILEPQTETDVGVVNIEDIIIKEERNEELVLDDECEQTENIIEGNAQISDISVAPLTENENICEQTELKYDKKLSKCKICKKSFEYSQNLETHLLTHTKKTLSTCSICGKSVQNLRKHNLIHGSERPHKCKICNKSFRILYILQQHHLVHTGEKPFTCDVCNKSFGRSSDLKNHKLIHTGEKPFTCEICNKSFRQSINLKKHKLVHTGEKPFTCEICNKLFRESSNLNKHKLLHTGEKPYTCEVCDKSFKLLHHLKQHKLVHSNAKPYTCEVCNKTFRQSSNLNTHKLVHTAEKPHTCEVCNKSFRHSQTLKKHKLLHTTGATPTRAHESPYFHSKDV